MVGQEFDEHRMRRLAVKDDDAFDALFKRIDAGFHFRDHAAGYRAVCNESVNLLDAQFLDQNLVLVEDAGTSVKSNSRFALSAPAMAPANVSALML